MRRKKRIRLREEFDWSVRAARRLRAWWSVEGKVSGSQPRSTRDFVLRWPRGNERFRIKTSLRDHGWQRRFKTEPVRLYFDISSVIQLKQSNFPSRSEDRNAHHTVPAYMLICNSSQIESLFNPNRSDRPDAFRDVTYAKCFKLPRLETTLMKRLTFWTGVISAVVNAVRAIQNRCLFFLSVHIHCMQRVSITHEEWGDAGRT